MAYSRDQILKVRHAIADALPGCLFHESDYGFGLSVSNAERTKGVVLFTIDYDLSAGENIKPIASYGVTLDDVPRIVAALTA